MVCLVYLNSSGASSYKLRRHVRNSCAVFSETKETALMPASFKATAAFLTASGLYLLPQLRKISFTFDLSFISSGVKMPPLSKA